jgi:hypothetical protein
LGRIDGSIHFGRSVQVRSRRESRGAVLIL